MKTGIQHETILLNIFSDLIQEEQFLAKEITLFPLGESHPYQDDIIEAHYQADFQVEFIATWLGLPTAAKA